MFNPERRARRRVAGQAFGRQVEGRAKHVRIKELLFDGLKDPRVGALDRQMQ